MPTSVGGPGCTALQQVLVQEQVRPGHQRPGLGDGTPRRSGGPRWPPTTSASAGCCPPVRGEKHEAYAITEEFAGSDVSDLQTTARRDGDEYVVNGVKWHVTSYNLADYVFVAGRADDGEHAGEHVLLVVDLPWPGVEVVRTPHYSHHIADEHPIVVVHRRARARPRTWSAPRARDDVHPGLVPVRAADGGRALRRRRAAPRRRDDRVRAGPAMVGGKPLGEYQLVAGMLADSATELFAARTMLYEVARVDRRRRTTARRCTAQASMAKLYCSEMAGRVADRAVQVFGGRGYMRENVAERMFRELRVERIWEGASEIQRIIVARQTDELADRRRCWRASERPRDGSEGGRKGTSRSPRAFRTPRCRRRRRGSHAV